MNPQDGPADMSQIQNQAGDEPADNAAAPDIISQQPSVPAADPAVTEISLPVEAEDSDLIEKEWVDRAKQIVDHTRDNPYEQQRALSEMKADYMKKRYGKDIKLHES